MEWTKEKKVPSNYFYMSDKTWDLHLFFSFRRFRALLELIITPNSFQNYQISPCVIRNNLIIP